MQSPVNTAPEPGGAGSGSSALSCGPPYAIVTAPTAVVSHGILNHPALWTGTGKLSFGFPSSFFFFFNFQHLWGKRHWHRQLPCPPGAGCLHLHAEQGRPSHCPSAFRDSKAAF